MRFEYKIIDSRKWENYKKLNNRDIEEKLNEYGKEGWEIIDVEFQGLTLDKRFFIAFAKRKLN